MHSKLNRTYYQLATVLLTGILMLGTVGTGFAHVLCLVEDHQMCDMHAGAMGNDNHSHQSAKDNLSTHTSCNHINVSEALVVEFSNQADMPDEDCLCYIQAEIKAQTQVKPTVTNKLTVKTVLEVESIINDSVLNSSKPFLFNSDRIAACYPSEAVYLVNSSFII